ncbi:MAG: HD domain-containing protein, partial [Candidatus Kapaibacteriota bacterium]
MLLYPEKESKKAEAPRFGKGEKKDLVSFLNYCKKFSPNLDENLIKKAFQYNVEANKNLYRRSGDPFYTHPLEVAAFLVENIMFDNEMIVAALLHDVIGKNELYTLNDIETEFGNVVSLIVDNVQRITNLERREIGDIEYFRRLILALTTDIRIIFIKIADRYHDMKTISYLLPETQRKIAEDTMQIYVPLAHRFGLYLIKSELEDLSFKVLDKENYEKIVHKLKMTKKERDEYLRNFAKQ